VYVIDPLVDYRYRTFKRIRKDTGKTIDEQHLEDYRLVDGIWYPFRQEERRFTNDGEPLEETRIAVATAKLNVDLDEKAFTFRVPAGWRVIDSTRGERFLLEEDAEVTLDNARTIQPRGVQAGK
jgi:hypothetical protein